MNKSAFLEFCLGDNLGKAAATFVREESTGDLRIIGMPEGMNAVVGAISSASSSSREVIACTWYIANQLLGK